MLSKAEFAKPIAMLGSDSVFLKAFSNLEPAVGYSALITFLNLLLTTKMILTVGV